MSIVSKIAGQERHEDMSKQKYALQCKKTGALYSGPWSGGTPDTNKALRFDRESAEAYISDPLVNVLTASTDDAGNPGPWKVVRRDDLLREGAEERRQAKARHEHGERIKARAEANAPWPLCTDLYLTDPCREKIKISRHDSNYILVWGGHIGKRTRFMMSRKQSKSVISFLQAILDEDTGS